MTNRSKNIDSLWRKVSKNTGYVVRIILTLTIMAVKSFGFRNSTYYIQNVMHDNVYLTDEQLAVFETESKLMCLMLCHQNEQCQSVSYNSLSMRCQHFLVTFWNRQNIIGTNESGWLHFDPLKANDCTDLYDKQHITGIYSICPGNIACFNVKCEMDVDGGGWTVIQERFDGTVDFQRSWIEYKAGFGDVKGEHWLGNDPIHAITISADYELRIDMSDWTGNSWYAVYKTFKVGNENSQYMLTIGNYSGNAGDSMEYHKGMKFSTMDRDNDAAWDNCAKHWGGNGGWWYNACDEANLNSLYGRDIGGKTGIEWESALGKGAPTMKITRMMIRKL